MNATHLPSTLLAILVVGLVACESRHEDSAMAAHDSVGTASASSESPSARPAHWSYSGEAGPAVLAGVFYVLFTTCQDGVCDEGNPVSVAGVAALVLYATLILGVCLLACVVPTRRALAVEPVDALRTE